MLKRLTGNRITKVFIKTALALATAWSLTTVELIQRLSIVPTIVFVLLFLLFRKLDLSLFDKRTRILTVIEGSVFSLFLFLGNLKLLSEGTLSSFLFKGCVFFVSIALSTAAILFEVNRLLLKLEFKSLSLKKQNRVGRFFIFIFFILLCWLPYFLSYYPGSLSIDSIEQLSQIVSNAYTNHHPFIHTMLIKLFYSLGFSIFGSACAAVATYVVAQMVIFAAMLSVSLIYLENTGVSKWFTYVLLAFYALCPFVAIYSITVWKDIIAGGLVLLMTMTAHFISISDKNEEKLSVLSLIGLWGLSFLFCTFRSNQLYAYILLIPVILLCFKKNRLRLAVVMASVVIAVIIYNGPVLGMMNVAPPDIAESLSIPEQQIAYTVVNGGNISHKDYELINNVVDVSKIEEVYYPHISDNIKLLIRSGGNQEYITAHKAEFLMLYLRLGIHNPLLFVEAFVYETSGYWYPKTEYWIYSAGISENSLGLDTVSLLGQGCQNCIISIMLFFQRLFHTFWDLALCLWAVIFSLFLALQKRKRLFCYAVPLAVIASILLGTPVWAEFRYAFGVFLTVPFIIAITFIPEKETQNELQNN